MTKVPEKVVSSIGDLVPDPKNARRHNPRNIALIGDSLQNVGAARSIVIDENNVILAGNGVIEAAGERGIEKVQVVEADGSTIIAVRRRGLTEKQKAELAIADNRAGELSDWDEPALQKLIEETGAEVTGFTDEELGRLLPSGETAETELRQLDVREPPPTMTWVLIGIPTPRYGTIAKDVEAIARVDGTFVETTDEPQQRDGKA